MRSRDVFVINTVASFFFVKLVLAERGDAKSSDFLNAQT
jgi:hypothetical protein